MSLKHDENKATLVWLSEELRRYEASNGHAEITIVVVGGKACRVEPGEKILVERLLRCP